MAESQMGADLVAALAAEIRRVDGNHTLGAARLAEELAPFIAHQIARGDLRAKVKALPIVNMAVAIGEWDGQPVVPLSDVLALLPEVSE